MLYFLILAKKKLLFAGNDRHGDPGRKEVTATNKKQKQIECIRINLQLWACGILSL